MCVLIVVLIIVLLHWAFPQKVHAAAEPPACNATHVAMCHETITFWHHKASVRLAAVRWQQKERGKIAAQLAALRKRLRTPVQHLAEWTCIHGKEGAWNDTGDPYWGGLQMDRTFMTTYGRDMIAKYGGWAHLWTPRDQMIVAERAYDAGRGFNPWPNTARACGLL